MRILSTIIFVLFSCALSYNLTAQSTPALTAGCCGANVTSGEAGCGASSNFDTYSYTEIFDDGAGNAGGTGEAVNGTNTLGLTWEYVGSDPNVDNQSGALGTGISFNLQTAGTEALTFIFDEAHTNPVFEFSGFEGASKLKITDCDDVLLATVKLGGSMDLVGMEYTTGATLAVQVTGTHSCIKFSTDMTTNFPDAWTIQAKTCIPDAPPPVAPACATCTVPDKYKLIRLTNKTGTGTGATADVELNNVKVGTATVLFSDLDRNVDLSGTQFGGWDTDGGTLLLQLDFCEEIMVDELDIRNLEVESQVSVGTMITGTGAAATLSGLTLTYCAGSTRMDADDITGGNLVTTAGPGCSANPNGTYTIGGTSVGTLYFKYHNPPGGCTGDYVGFRIGTCVPDAATTAVPVCPINLVTVTTDIADVIANGVTPANSDTYVQDANGNYFDYTCTSTTLQNAVTNGTPLTVKLVGPCAAVVDEEACSFCTPVPPCTACPAGSDYKYISLDKTGTNAMTGLDVGLVEINGVCIGSYEFLFSDLDIRTDGQGTTFGGFDNDGGTMLLQLDFCDPLNVQQLDIRNLEVMSQVSVGTTITGTGAAATLGGQVLTFCAGSTRMDGDDITNGNLVTTAGPGCGANPNASYTFGTNPVSTLYFKYHNPPGGCSFDYVGFKIGTCFTPPPMAVPVCPIEVVKVTCDMEDVIANGINPGNTDEYAVDGNGNYFDFQTCHATLIAAVNNATPLQTVHVGCAELVETSEECVIMGCVITPQCMASTCPPNTTFEYISLNRTNTNPALPIGIVNLNNVQVGTYEFLFGDLDNSLDGNGTTFGGWDTDGGTLLLKLEFCTPLTIIELDIRNLEVGSQVSVGTVSSTTDATAVLSGQTLTHCSGSTRMLLNDGAPNLVITDGPGCGANPNATYTVGTNPVSTFYFKYHNPPSDGTFPSRCRGDYVGFKIAACAPTPQMAVPECSLQLFNVTDANGSQMLVRDKNGKYYNYSGACPAAFPTMPLIETIISPCATVVFVEECSVCVIPGLAKTVTSCVQASSGIAGNADVTFKFTLANHGAAEMINLQINDNMNAIGGFVKVVSPPVVTMVSAGGTAPTPNAAYAGVGNLLNGTTGSLNNSEQIMVEVVVEIDPTNTGSSETNSATGGGTPPAGSPVFLDDSDNGTIPHPHEDATDMDDPTPLQFPKINLAKEITDVRPAGTPGKFLVDMILRVKNTGNVTLNNVIVEDDIASQLGASFVGVTVPPVQDPAYNGATNIDIPVGTLTRNQLVAISFTIEVMTPVSGSNQATTSGEGVGPMGMMVTVTDDSDAGPDPEGQNPSTPGGGPGSSDPTFFGPGVQGPGPNGPVSLSCPARINVTLDQNCKATLPANFGGVSPNGALIAIEIFVDGVYVGNMLNETHLWKEIIYQFTDLSTGEVCWGKINLEDKNIPPVMTSTTEVMCSQPLPKLKKLADVEKDVNGACGTPVTSLTESWATSGDACTGFLSIRKITGLINIDGTKSYIDLRIDTIKETPLDTMMVICPDGGPGQQDALELECEKLDGKYPSPEVVAYYFEEYYKSKKYPPTAAKNKAIQKAYPYINKGMAWDSVINKITPDTMFIKKDSMILFNGIWVNFEVVRKVITFDTTYTKFHHPVNLPVPKGVTCNLTVKCTDMHFAGCAGDSSKIMRTWNILDWCNGSIKECMQWIIVKPDDPYFTKVLGKKVTKNKDGTIDFYKMWPDTIIKVDIAPWTCAGELELTAMVDVSCAPGYEIHWSSTFGQINDNILGGLWLGEMARVTATVTSDCGSHGVSKDFHFKVMPLDNILPVPVAEDEVNVSLTGDPTGAVSDDGGIAKVFVDAIDAGSHNAGCGEVDACLLLKEELEDPIWIYDPNGKQVQATVVIQYPHHKDTVLIYHASGCRADGILKGVDETKLTPGRPDYPYVYCKEFVKFCCADIGENLVALVVTNGGGRTAYSWSRVIVEDKSLSTFSCHSGATVACDKGYDPYDYAPTFQSPVCAEPELEYTIAGDANACGDGLDIITWTLDGQVICTTKIYFDGKSTFNPYEIKWPKHYTGDYELGVVRECELWLDDEGDPVLDKDGNEQYRIVEYKDEKVYMGAAFDCAEGDDTGQPVWCQAACALVGSSFEPLEVEAADACKKIIRRWTVIDWCTWDPNTANPDDDNDTEYDQFQAVDDLWLDEYDPTQAGAWHTDYREAYDNPPVNYPDGGWVTKLECASCEKLNERADDVYFRYKVVDEDGYYTFDQVIKIIDETDPVIDALEEVKVIITDGATSKTDNFDDCYADADISATVTDMCGETDLSADGAAWWIELYTSNADGERITLVATRTAFGGSATINSQSGTQGDYHLIVWQVRDGCGNLSEAETLIYFHDDKQPTPICIQDLSTAIMPSSGTVEIWAADYDNGSFDNCSEVEFWFLVDSLGYPTDDQENGTFIPNLQVTCDMLTALGGSETITLGLYVSDAEDNIDFCNISLNVNGAGEICDLAGSGVSIQGEVATAFGDMVEGVEVALNVGAKDITEADGKYAFNGNVMHTYYEIKSQKNKDYMNGISTLDMVLIQQHVLGISLLDNPYKVIAADINNDSRISALDLVDLRRLVLGMTQELPRNESWRFIDAAQIFEDHLAPFPFTEILRVSDLEGDMHEQNFIGVKIGDVSGNVIANSAIADNREVTGTLSFETKNHRLAQGDLVDIAIKGKDFVDIIAYQFTMDLNGLEFIGASSGSINIEDTNFGILDSRTVTMAWYSPEGVTSEDDLFTMTFKATESVLLSEALTISSRVTASAAYTSAHEKLDVEIEYLRTGNTGQFSLLQNTPNPFSDYTRIGFELPTGGTATLTVFDIAGKTIYEKDDEFSKGYNEILLKKSNLGSSGVLYYQLQNAEFTATRKMILVH